jgi:WD40 repeat protein
MDQNALIEIGSKADVVIRFNANTTINGQDIAANEPYLFLRDVNVALDYTNNSKIGTTTPQNRIATSLIYPTAVSIGGVQFSRKVASLLACFQDIDQTFGLTKIRSFVADEDTIYLTEKIDETKPIFIYDGDFNKITVFTYDEGGDSITSIEFVDTNQYLISYSTVEQGTRFNLVKPPIPYMSLEIQAVGNINKASKKVVLYLNKVSLDSVLNFNFLKDGTISAPLNFVILETENYIYMED